MSWIISCLTRRCRASRPQPENQHPPYQGLGMDKRLPAGVCKLIFKGLTNAERSRIFRTCHTFQTNLRSDGFELLAGRCQTVVVKNVFEPGSSFLRSFGFQEGMPPPFFCFDYDPPSQCVMTGDVGYSSPVCAKMWDRHGNLVKKMNGDELVRERCAHFVNFSTQDNVASYVSLEGAIKMRNLETGKVLCDEEYVTTIVTAVSPNLQRGSIACGLSSGAVYLVERDGSGKYQKRKLGEHPGAVDWICDVAERNIVYSCSSSDNVLRIWKRAEGKPAGVCDGFRPNPRIVYDAPSHQLFAYSKLREVWAIDGSSSRVLDYGDDRTAECTALHYDPLKKWLFAGFNYTEKREWRLGRRDRPLAVINQSRPAGKIVVWDITSGRELRTVPSTPVDMRQIDFDPKTNTLLVAATGGVKLWDFGSGRQIRAFAGEHTEFRWDKPNQLIVLFKKFDGVAAGGLPIGGTLSLLDYSGAVPSQRLESKEDSKEQPKKE